MKGFVDISMAIAWFVICVVAALFLLAAALVYSGILMLRRSQAGKKIEFPKIQFAR